MAGSEGLRIARLMMVLSSLSPLFVLWAIRGIPNVPDSWVTGVCIAFLVLPNGVLLVRILICVHRDLTAPLAIDKAEDHREHLLVYLFAVLLPLWAANLTYLRDIVATGVAFAFVVFLFYHLNLHYMNLGFAALGYRVFTVIPCTDGNPLKSRSVRVLITARAHIDPGTKIKGLRLSNTVFFETRRMLNAAERA